MITAFLTADLNILPRDVRTRGAHLRAFARIKYELNGPEVARFMTAPSPAELIAGVREFREEHPLQDLRHTLNVTGPERRMIVYSHFIVPEHKTLLIASDQLTRYIATCPPPQPAEVRAVIHHRARTPPATEASGATPIGAQQTMENFPAKATTVRPFANPK